MIWDMKLTKKIIYDLRQRDEDTFEKLYNEYIGLIYTIVSKYISNDEIYDLIQASFMKLIIHLDNNEPNYEDLRLLVSVIANSVSLDYVRKYQRTKVLFNNEICDNAADKSDEKSVIYEYQYILTQDEYELIYYRFVQGYSLLQISKMKDTTIDIIKKLSSKAMEKIRKYEIENMVR